MEKNKATNPIEPLGAKKTQVFKDVLNNADVFYILLKKSKESDMSNENAKIDETKLLNALKNVVNENVTLKKNISLSEWLELKKALSPINNYITKELTNRFIEVLPKLFKNTSNIFENIDIQKIKDDNNNINVNANGYDFVYPDSDNPTIVAEVKANIPYEGNKYGGSQKTGLKNDIEGLLDPNKKKGNNKKPDLTKSNRFLVVLDYKGNGYNTSNAIDDLINWLQNKRDNKIKFNGKIKKIENLNNPSNLSTDKVYIVMLKV